MFRFIRISPQVRSLFVFHEKMRIGFSTHVVLKNGALGTDPKLWCGARRPLKALSIILSNFNSPQLKEINDQAEDVTVYYAMAQVHIHFCRGSQPDQGVL